MEHVYSGGSCTEDAICENCGAVEAAPGHDYIPANCVESATCRVCGATEGEPVGHKLKGLSCSQCDYSLASLSEMARVCSIQATCETDFSACLVDTENGHNPYDVIWDYGEGYQIYVDACDWSKVFDVSYYKKTFPMLAAQYHDDDALLLEHFQTVGIHEGRQGCKDFNVQAYYNNVDSKISKAFEKNWAAKYRDSEKHYKAMVNEKYHYGGYSNAYYVKGLTSQFDVFVKSLDTAMHPKEYFFEYTIRA